MHRTKRFTRVFFAAAAALLLTSSGALAQICGDPTGDGNVTDADGVNVLRAAASLSSACTPQTCDVNGDGVINDVDGVNVLRAAAQLPATLECLEAEINEFLSNVETEEGQPPAELRVGAAPVPGQGAPDTIGQIEGNTAVVAGGSNTVKIPYDATAQAAAAGIGPAQVSGLFMVIAIADLEGQFSQGYFTIPLSTLVGEITITVFFPQSLGSGSFLLCPATELLGVLSQYGVLQQDPQMVQTGQLQVSLSFQPAQDLDLHLVEPNNGEEIFYANKTSAAGGMLDLDSNGGCLIDNVNNENITYGQSAGPPHGLYTIKVVFFDACPSGGASFTVVLNNNGLRSSINGSFAPGQVKEERLFQFTFPPPVA